MKWLVMTIYSTTWWLDFHIFVVKLILTTLFNYAFNTFFSASYIAKQSLFTILWLTFWKSNFAYWQAHIQTYSSTILKGNSCTITTVAIISHLFIGVPTTWIKKWVSWIGKGKWNAWLFLIFFHLQLLGKQISLCLLRWLVLPPLPPIDKKALQYSHTTFVSPLEFLTSLKSCQTIEVFILFLLMTHFSSSSSTLELSLSCPLASGVGWVVSLRGTLVIGG